MLYIFSGLPGTGKSTLSSALARELQAAYLRVDVVEQAMRDAGTWVDGPAGYLVCYAIASQNLRLGLDVIADTVNPIEETRQAWRNVAESLETPFVEIEVICSDDREHRHRVETSAADIPGLVLPTWEKVRNRQYDVWDRDHIVIDTAHQTAAESLMTLRELLDRERRVCSNDFTYLK
ncbi:AAA family ATPase [Paenibacillus chitinolyticus]|uniref:AAA family ATPase n=1 Tax=Paenibacillus chitinolyticus TaxID=79263 RepID=UPI00365F9633